MTALWVRRRARSKTVIAVALLSLLAAAIIASLARMSLDDAAKVGTTVGGLAGALALGFVSIQVALQRKDIRTQSRQLDAQREQLALQRDELELTRKEITAQTSSLREQAEVMTAQLESNEQREALKYAHNVRNSWTLKDDARMDLTNHGATAANLSGIEIRTPGVPYRAVPRDDLEGELTQLTTPFGYEIAVSGLRKGATIGAGSSLRNILIVRARGTAVRNGAATLDALAPVRVRLKFVSPGASGDVERSAYVDMSYLGRHWEPPS